MTDNEKTAHGVVLLAALLFLWWLFLLGLAAHYDGVGCVPGGGGAWCNLMASSIVAGSFGGLFVAALAVAGVSSR